MNDLIRREGHVIDFGRASDGSYEAVIAVNDDIGDGRPLRLRELELEDYMRNPVVLYNHNHDRWSQVPIGSTKSINWEARGMVARFDFLEGDEFAGRVRNAWERRFLRAASITAKPIRKGAPSGESSSWLTTDRDRYRLVEWSIVPVPADVDAVRSLYGIEPVPPGAPAAPPFTPSPTEQSEMNEHDVARIVRAEFDARDQESKRADETRNTMVSVLREFGLIKADAEGKPVTVDPGAGAATGAAATAEPQAARTEGAAAPAPSAAAPAVELTPEQQVEQKAQQRADALELCRGLLPQGFDATGKTTKEIYVAACGNEVEKADQFSEDYLRAKIEGIAERRRSATPDPTVTGQPLVGFQQFAPGQGPSRALNAVEIRELTPASAPAQGEGAAA